MAVTAAGQTWREPYTALHEAAEVRDLKRRVVMWGGLVACALAACTNGNDDGAGGASTGTGTGASSSSVGGMASSSSTGGMGGSTSSVGGIGGMASSSSVGGAGGMTSSSSVGGMGGMASSSSVGGMGGTGGSGGGGMGGAGGTVDPCAPHCNQSCTITDPDYNPMQDCANFDDYAYHCGNCEVFCGVAEHCSNGTCVANAPFLTAAGLAEFHLDATHLYYLDSAGIHRVPLSGGAASTVTTESASSFVMDATTIYFADGAASIKSVPKMGGASTTLATGVSPNELLVDATHLYWSDAGGLHRIATSGMGAPMLLTSWPPDAIAQSSTTLYAHFPTFNEGAILESNVVLAFPKSGGAPSIIELVLDTFIGLAADEDYAYVKIQFGGVLFYEEQWNAYATAFTPAFVADADLHYGSLDNSAVLASDQTHVYYIGEDQYGYSLFRSGRCPNAEELPLVRGGYDQIEVDATHVYFLSQVLDTIWRLAK